MKENLLVGREYMEEKNKNIYFKFIYFPLLLFVIYTKYKGIHFYIESIL